MGFRLVPKSVTLNDLKRRNGHVVCYFAELVSFCGLLRARCSAIVERPRRRVRYSFGKKWKSGTGRQYFTDIIGLSSTTVI